ncbi:MAG: T9SS type A sorting domain-containing protein [Bacteroidales bacterium]|nr:T9SS type A sorting domain-containing protein [Bacteroidales bacterium]
MKKLCTLIVVLFLAHAGMSQSSLPNGNFESWTYFPAFGYYEPDGGFFKTLNSLDTVPTPSGVSAYPTDSAHAGNKAVRLITREIVIAPVHILIPGVIGTLKVNMLTEDATLGTPYTWATKAERFQGYYMAFPLNGDSIAAILLLSKWNNSTHQRDTIAYTRLVFHGTVDTYTEFDAPITYWNNTTMPDSITILLLSCAGYNAVNMMGSVGQIGSQAYFDDVTLTNIAGIEMLLMPDVDVLLAPNPASDRMTVTVSEVIKNGLFEVYNTQGKKIRQYPVNSISETLDVSSLTNGMYYYNVTDGTRTLNTGSFIIAK